MLRIFKQYYPIRNIIFVLVEGLIIWATVAVTATVVSNFGGYPADSEVFYKALLFTFICQICLYYLDLYENFNIKFKIITVKLLQALGMAAIIVSVIYFIFPAAIIEYRFLSYSIFLIALMIMSWRIGYAEILKIGLFNKPIIILGADEMA